MEESERGASLSVLVLLWVFAILIMAGLVVDGGQKVTAARRAESVAAGAARAAADAGATARLAGRTDPGASLLAARRYLDGSPGVTGRAYVAGGVVRVETESVGSTIFLSLLGIGEVRGVAAAEADLVRAGGGG